jgi:hypothetical protein
MSDIAVQIKEQVYKVSFPLYVAGSTGAGGTVTWNDVTGKPATFPPSAHTHPASEISDSTTAGRTILTAADAAAQRTALSLGNVDNTSDANKPVSSATQTALNGKANTVHTHVIGDVTGLQTLLDDAFGTPLNQATVKVAYNQTGSAIAKGQAVYVNGSQGTRLTVALANANSEATAARTIGIAAQAIADNASGYITCVGILSGLNTNSLTEGQAIWLAPSAGGLTSTRPTQPNHGVIMGWCVKQGSGSSGIIYVKVDNGLELNELHDVLLSSPANGQVLTYDSTVSLWKNQTPSGITNGQSIANALIFG